MSYVINVQFLQINSLCVMATAVGRPNGPGVQWSVRRTDLPEPQSQHVLHQSVAHPAGEDWQQETDASTGKQGVLCCGCL